MLTRDSRDPLGKGLFFLLVAIAVAVTLLQRAFPSQDGPLHLYYTDVLANLLRGTGLYRHDFEIKHVFPPYAFQPYLLIALNTVFAPLLAEKLLVAIYIAGFALAFRYLVHAIEPSNEMMPLVGVPLALNKLLFMGFYNFSLGVATAIFTVGFWLRNFDRLTFRRSIAFLGLVVLLATMHPIALLVTLMFLGTHVALYVASRLLAAAGSFSERAKTAIRQCAPQLGCAAGAGLPLLWIFVYASSGGKVTLFAPELRRIKQLVTLTAFTPFKVLSYRLLLIALIAALAVAAAVQLARVWRLLRFEQLTLPLMIAACAVLYVLVPWEVINGGAHFPDRFPVFAFVFAAAIGAGLRFGPQIERRLVILLGAAGILCVASQAVLKERILADLKPVYDAPLPLAHLRAAIVASVPMTEREELPFNFLPEYWAAANYFRRAGATFVNYAWLDGSLMMLKPRRAEPCSYADAYPMLECLAHGTPEPPELLVVTNGGGDERPTIHLAQTLGLVRLPFTSPWLEFYARPAAVQAALPIKTPDRSRR